MTKNPDKWIRKGVYAALGEDTYRVYDSRVPASNYPLTYIILSTQTKTDNVISKCGGQWECTILLDLVSRFVGAGNPGDREPLNDMENYVISSLQDISVDGFEVFSFELESSTSLDNINNTENVFRQLVRYRLVLTEA